MTLIKTSLLNAIAVIIKMGAMLGINKVLAIYVGPAGYAVIGQFQNAIQMITTFSSGAINTGVTKYTAEYYNQPHEQIQVWRTASTISVTGALIAAALVSVFNRPLAAWLLKNEDFGSVFIWFSVALVFFVLNALLLAILNGKKEIAKYIAANITGSIFSVVVTVVLVVKLGLYGALVGLAVHQSLNFFVIAFFVAKSNWFKFEYFFGKLDKQAVRNLAKYTAMALTSAACVPFSHIMIRNHLGNTLGWDAAGCWEAMWRLSGAYLMFVTTTLSVYYLPRLSELTNPSDIKKEILQGYRIILTVAAACSLAMYLMRDNIIELLFTEEFAPMRELFAWQMFGDTLKIGSWLLGYLLVAKALTIYFVLTEIFFAALFFAMVYFGVDFYGLPFASVAHTVNYFIHFVVMILILRKERVI